MFSTLHLRFFQSLKGVTTQVNVRKVYTSCKIFTFDQRMTQPSGTKTKPGMYKKMEINSPLLEDWRFNGCQMLYAFEVLSYRDSFTAKMGHAEQLASTFRHRQWK